MALRVKDILEMNQFKEMEVVAGFAGLDRHVSGVGIADFEFTASADPADRDAFEPNMIVLSSLLFAKEDESLILSTIEFFEELNAPAFIYKPAIFHELPRSVLDFADEHDFPIIKCSMDLYMDTIVFDILDAIRTEDNNFFSEENISLMITSGLTKAQSVSFCKNISLKLKKYSMFVYIKGNGTEFPVQLARCLKAFYLNRNLNSRVLLSTYQEGLMALMTANSDKAESFQIILNDLLAFLSAKDNNLYVSTSNVFMPYTDLDKSMRECYFTHLASVAEQQHFQSYNHIGVYQILIPLMEEEPMKDYMNSVLQPILEKPNFFETAKYYTICNGDIFKTAGCMSANHNTIRYRLNKMKQLIFSEEMTDQEFYSNLSLAVRLFLLMEK